MGNKKILDYLIIKLEKFIKFYKFKVLEAIYIYKYI
jgi:hypothetical protein